MTTVSALNRIATVAGEAWHLWADPVLAELGAMPGAALSGVKSTIKKQGTRMLEGGNDDEQD